MRDSQPRVSGRFGLLAAFALVAVACAPGAGVAPTTTATPTTTTAPPTTTTTATTTTLPPGLQPQPLRYGFGDAAVWEYDFTQTTSVSADADLFGTDGTAEVDLKLEGRSRVVVLPSIDGAAWEVSGDFRPTSGELSAVADGSSFSEELSGADLGDYVTVGLTAIGDRRGRVVESAKTGSPGFSVQENPAVVLATVVGPAFSDDAVDDGDGWTVTHEDALLGAIELEASITEEVETAEGFLFRIVFAMSALDLPKELDQNDLEGLTESGLVGSLFGGAAVEIDFLGLEVTGEGLFDPLRGVFVELDSELLTDVRLSVDVFGDSVRGGMTIGQRTSSQLTEVDTPTSFEIAAAVGFHEVDPERLAIARLPVAEGVDYFGGSFEAAQAIRTKLIDETGGIVANWAWGGRFESGETDEDFREITVAVAVNTGSVRGWPGLAEDLAGVWSGRTPTAVDVGGRTAWRVDVDGQEWLVGSDAAHTYVVLGDRSLAEQAMADYLGANLPYRWQQGDCLDLGGTTRDLPTSPYGEFGVVHCHARHRYEVIHSEALAEPDEAVDRPDDLAAQAFRTCGAAFLARAGAYPLSSDLGLVSYLPSQEEWDAGLRYIACLAYSPTASGLPESITGFLEAARSDVEIAVGTCLRRENIVACDDAHDAEVVGGGTYDAPADAPYPDLGDLFDDLGSLCEPHLAAYGVTEGELTVEARAITDMTAAWDDGFREFHCVAVATTDGGAPATISGSFLGEWEPATGRFGT